MKEYTWLYNTYNDNVYSLLFIILILSLIIFLFNYWKRRNDYIEYSMPDETNKEKTTKDKSKNISKSQFVNVNTNSTVASPTVSPSPTVYQPPMATNPANNLFVSDAEKDQWKLANELLDGNEESLQNTNDAQKTQYINDVLQTHSTLFQDNYDIGNSKNIKPDNYSTIGDYATLDTLGKGLTDTLGGVDTSLGYTVLEEQLGTFKKEENVNPYAYDNTFNYNTGMDAKTVDGITTQGSGLSGKFLQNNKPIFLQKDFDGVANIFAPNIIIQNPPLTSDGYPDISFQM